MVRDPASLGFLFLMVVAWIINDLKDMDTGKMPQIMGVIALVLVIIGWAPVIFA